MSFDFKKFSFKKILFFTLIIFLNLSVLALIFRILLFINILPEFRPAIDIDRVVITSKIDLSKNLDPPDIIFLGDSSCLMNIDTKYISKKTNLNAFNLGTLSFLNINTYPKLINNLYENNKLPKIIFLIVHPELLRKASYSDNHMNIFNSYNNKINSNNHENFLDDFLSINIFKNRIYSRIPIPLNNNEFRNYYGFTTTMNDFISDNYGSAVDPRKLNLNDSHGNTLYKISSNNLNMMKDLSINLPSSIKLFLCLSPVPEELTGNNYSNLIDEMYNEIDSNIENITLIRGPYTYKGDLFSTKTHLNEKIRKAYNDSILELLKASDINEK